MRKSVKKSARKSAGERIRVALQDPASGRFIGSLSIDAALWEFVELLCGDAGKAATEIIEEAVRVYRESRNGKAVAA